MTDDCSASPPLEFARQSLRSAASAVLSLESVLDADFLDCLDRMERCSGHIYVTGVGASGAIAARLAHLLRLVGTRCSHLSASDALHGALGGTSAEDLLLVISKGGQSDELNQAVAGCLDRGLSVIAFTSTPGTPLALMADKVILLPLTGERDHGGAIATASGVAQAALGDAMVVALLARRGQDWQAVAAAHPAGIAGQLLREKASATDRDS